MAGVVAASTIINYIACMVTIGFRFIQLRIHLQFNGAGDIAFQGFVLKDKSVSCFKLFISAYRQVHNEGIGLFALSCLFGLSLDLCAILIHLYNNHTRRATAWISGMAIFLASGACMLAVKIPQDYAWHSSAVEVVLDMFICLEALLLVLNKMSENGGNENLLQDLIMISVETLTNYWLFANYVGNTHSPWDADKILHLVGSCMALLIALGQIVWIAYKAHTHGVFTWGEEQAGGAAADGGDVEQQVPEECDEVEESGGKTPSREVEMAADGDSSTMETCSTNVADSCYQ